MTLTFLILSRSLKFKFSVLLDLASNGNYIYIYYRLRVRRTWKFLPYLVLLDQIFEFRQRPYLRANFLKIQSLPPWVQGKVFFTKVLLAKLYSFLIYKSLNYEPCWPLCYTVTQGQIISELHIIILVVSSKIIHVWPYFFLWQKDLNHERQCLLDIF